MSSAKPPTWLFSNNTSSAGAILNHPDSTKHKDTAGSRAAKMAKAKERKMKTLGKDHEESSTAVGNVSNVLQAPAELLDLVGHFLSEHGFATAAQAYTTQRKKSGVLAKVEGAVEHPVQTLKGIFEAWQAQEAGSRGDKSKVDDAKQGAAEAERKSSDESEGSDSSDSSDEADSDSESDSDSDSGTSASGSGEDVVMADAKESAAGGDESDSESSDSSSSGSSESEEEEEDEEPRAGLGIRTPAPPPPSNSLKRKASVSDSESSGASDSSEDEMRQGKRQKTKATSKVKKQDAAKGAEGSDGSSSDGSDSDGDDSGSSSSSSSNSSDSDSVSGSESESESESEPDSDSEANKKAGVEKPTKDTVRPSITQADSESSVTMGKTSPDLISTSTLPPLSDKTNNRKATKTASFPEAHTSSEDPHKTTNAPFSRIKKDIQVDPRLSSNAFHHADDWGRKAHEDLIVTKGKGFTKEKNKKKRGSYRGGMIDTNARNGIKFED